VEVVGLADERCVVVDEGEVAVRDMALAVGVGFRSDVLQSGVYYCM
jgi:hypothetical protein